MIGAGVHIYICIYIFFKYVIALVELGINFTSGSENGKQVHEAQLSVVLPL